MNLSQHEAVSLLNHTIFRPGWTISARPAPGDDSQVLVGIEIATVDSSFVTRGGQYSVPLTERALIRVSADDYGTPEALLFRLLAFIQEDLLGHEDREFLRTWDAAAERWTAPFHSHVPEGAQAWDRMEALPRAAVTRVGAGAPWAADREAPGRAVSAGCDNEDDRGDCWESGNAGGRAASVAPCYEEEDEEGPQRVLMEADCTLGPPERARQRAFASAAAHASAHPVRMAGCNECAGGCASWG
jgi:hypothetical protein